MLCKHCEALIPPYILCREDRQTYRFNDDCHNGKFEPKTTTGDKHG